MSSVDKRLERYWLFATQLHRTGKQTWLDYIRQMAENETGIAQKAAQKLLARREKVKNAAHTG